MDQDRMDVLLAKYLAGELSPEENEELEWAVLANPALRVTLQVLQRMREMPPGGSTAEEREMLERGLQRITRQPAVADQPLAGIPHQDTEHQDIPYQDIPHQDGGSVRRMPGRWWMAAAAVLVLGVAGGLLYHGERHPNIADATPIRTGHDKEITTRYGTRNFLELPDGSKLWLNAGSKVKYAEDRRELTLEGEAFFDVKHDPDHPFIIHTGKLDVRVLGTSFNVKAYPDDSTIETTLIKGKVEIDFPGNTQPGIVLRPNEKVVIPKKEEPVAQNTDEYIDRKMVAPDPVYRTLIETSWVEDKLAFRNESFSDVSKRLERWYNIHFSFEDQQYLQGRLTGCFKDQPIKNVMDALQISFGFHYRIDGDTIRIW